MDGSTVAITVSSVVVISGSIIGCFIKQSRVIGKLEGKFDGFKETMDAKVDGLKDALDRTFDAHDQRITRLEDIDNRRKQR